MDDLRRHTYRGQAVARCDYCPGFRVDGVWPEQARKRVREHVRETGHEAYARYEQTDYYKARQAVYPDTGVPVHQDTGTHG